MRSSLATALLLVLTACKGCEEQPAEPPMALPEAADEAIFASVERLGPHRCVATVTRQDTRDGTAAAPEELAVEIAWRDWDRFRYARTVNGEPASEVIVVDGRPWARTRGGRWEEREDAETWRVQLQSTWDTWDEALEPFGGRLALSETGRELIEGRWARRFTVALAPEPEGVQKRGRKPAFTPISLSGTVWLDEATAVRLLAEVQGEVQQGNLRRAITLRLARSDFGEDLGIRRPQVEGGAGRPGRTVPATGP